MDSFLAKNTSEDNASFEQIMDLAKDKERARHAWLYEAEAEFKQVSLFLLNVLCVCFLEAILVFVVKLVCLSFLCFLVAAAHREFGVAIGRKAGN